MNRYSMLIFMLTAFFLVNGCTGGAEEEIRPKNIILLIGDGMSYAHMQAGMLSSEATLNIEQFKNIGFIKTSSANNFVTDSGAAGTALATGVKTNNGFIGMDTDGNPVKSILHLANDNGLSTGIVVSCAVTHATPAAFIAHQPNRDLTEAIALDFLNTDVDVFIGGGRQYFESREDNRNLLEELANKGYVLANTMEEVSRVSSGKLAGLIAGGHPPRYSGGRGDMLPDGTRTAINILNQNPEGFFLMIEGAQIDWGGHDNDLDYIVDEMLDFDRTIGVALEFARQNGETLVIVTSDHDTGGMALNGFNRRTGQLVAGFTTDGHTALMQPVMAWGPGAEEFGGIYENTGVFDKMLHAFGFSTN